MSSMVKHKKKRRIRNMLLQPALQGKLGLYCTFLSAVFAASIYTILVQSFADISESVAELAGINPEQVREVIGIHWSLTQFWIYISSAFYIALILLLVIWFTHRMVGPTIAFRRHLARLQKGDFSAKTHLRKGDAFKEVADALNKLSDVMQRAYKSENEY